MTAPSDFTPLHVRHAGSLTVRAPLAEAFQFFTPEGERRWVEGWAPEYLPPYAGSCGPGTAFRTAHGGEETLWLVLCLEPAAGRARYARTTPGNRHGTVTIAAHAVDAGTTRVGVEYDLTALTPAGNATLAALTDEAFTAMIAEWERRVGACVGGKHP